MPFGEFKIVQKSRPLDPQLAILLGDSEVRSGKGADAVAMLTPLEAENAGNPDFEYVMGTALVAAGNRRDGVARLEKVAQTTNSADAYFLAGSTYMYLNEFEHARKDLEAALALNPKVAAHQYDGRHGARPDRRSRRRRSRRFARRWPSTRMTSTPTCILGRSC